MTDIYNSPGSEVNQFEPTDLRRSQKILCTLMSFFPAFLYGIPHKALPEFAETFASFNTPLSGLTVFVINIHPIFYWLGLLSLLPLLVWLGAVFQYRILRFLNIFSRVNTVLSSIIFTIFLWAAYSPIFELGQVV